MSIKNRLFLFIIMGGLLSACALNGSHQTSTGKTEAYGQVTTGYAVERTTR